MSTRKFFWIKLLKFKPKNILIKNQKLKCKCLCTFDTQLKYFCD